MKILLSLILIVLLNNCSEMKPEDYKDTKPVLKIEEYFEGYYDKSIFLIPEPI